jgi:WD40 repeat protein
VVTGSDDGTARVWDISFEGPRGVAELPAATPASSGGIAFTPDGRHLLAPSRAGDGVRVWDTRGSRAVLRLDTQGGHVQGISVSGDGAKIATTAADSTVEVWDARSGRHLYSITSNRNCPSGVTPCATAVFGPDGSTLAVGSADSTARILDAESGEERHVLLGHQGSIVNVAYSPDGRRLATASLDGTAKVWDIDAERQLLTLDPGSQEIADVGFTPDGRWLVTAGWDGRVRVWDASNGRQIRSWSARQGDLFDLAIAPNGRLATTGDAGGITLWKSVRGEEFLTIPSPGKTAVAFSPDGRRLTSSASSGQTVTIWPLEIAELVRLARSRVTRSLTDEECRRYLDTARCPQ